jgi:phage head maturation protease
MNRLCAELRAAEVSGKTLSGHAAVFGQLAELRGGWEAIAPGAFDEVLGRDDDVVALRDHNPSMLLGRRAAGTLRLETDDDGLAFEVDLPDTSYANDVRELVARVTCGAPPSGSCPARTSSAGPRTANRSAPTHPSAGSST